MISLEKIAIMSSNIRFQIQEVIMDNFNNMQQQMYAQPQQPQQAYAQPQQMYAQQGYNMAMQGYGQMPMYKKAAKKIQLKITNVMSLIAAVIALFPFILNDFMADEEAEGAFGFLAAMCREFHSDAQEYGFQYFCGMFMDLFLVLMIAGLVLGAFMYLGWINYVLVGLSIFSTGNMIFLILHYEEKLSTAAYLLIAAYICAIISFFTDKSEA